MIVKLFVLYRQQLSFESIMMKLVPVYCQDKSNCVLCFKVKNKAPAPVQITAEQLLREAKERQLELVPAVSTVHGHLLQSIY